MIYTLLWNSTSAVLYSLSAALCLCMLAIIYSNVVLAIKSKKQNKKNPKPKQTKNLSKAMFAYFTKY